MRLLLISVAFAVGLAFGQGPTHEQFDAPASSTLMVIGTGLVAVAALRRRKRDQG